MRRALMCLFLLCSTFAWSKTVDLKTGHWIIDRYRTVDLDKFDYRYAFKKAHLRGTFFELEDGSLWELCEVGPETKSFYATRQPKVEFDFVEEIVDQWQQGDELIFHKVADRDSLLIYNVTRDQLFDVEPFLPSLEPKLSIANIDKGAKQIVLSDNSIWQIECFCECKNWKVGDPMAVAKDTPWRSTNTHILINLCTCECDSTVEHIHPQRIGVVRVQ